jgi:hypothetical protein
VRVRGLASKFTELNVESVERQPDGQPDVGRTYKHLAELAAPVSTCKLL